jgi:enoyl-CoA hydratase/carnithine racemase
MPGSVTHDASVAYEALMPGVVQLRLNRPNRLNALGVGMVAALSEAVARAIDGKARVLIIRGTGRSFCAGADLKERQMMDEAAKFAHNRAINAAVDAVAAAPMPTIAVLNGLALGGGCELALACDIRIAAEGIQIGLTEARLGAIPGAGGTQRLPRLIGLSRALDMMFSAEPIEARRAETIGLVNMVVSDGELDGFAGRYAALLASRSPRAAAVLKQVVYGGTELPLADGLAKERDALGAIFSSSDYAEGLAAFAEKRPPRFSNERLEA